MATPEAVAEKRELAGINSDYKEKFGFHDSETGYAYKAPKGLSREVVESISEYKDEPQWMRDFRLKALAHFYERPTPKWGGNLYAIEDRCSHDDGPLAEGDFDASTCTVECPRHGSLFDHTTGKPKTLPAYAPVRTFTTAVVDDTIVLEV